MHDKSSGRGEEHVQVHEHADGIEHAHGHTHAE